MVTELNLGRWQRVKSKEFSPGAEIVFSFSFFMSFKFSLMNVYFYNQKDTYFLSLDFGVIPTQVYVLILLFKAALDPKQVNPET